ncbi:MAG TPA: alpha/beta hydrolase-fold protein [Ferruginibacter sp.]|nr:alpha/beta hydrolase-fold protein [Ferruginibacter sp.]HMP22092.1 alpha/beta hydrolase-fold protein [Ferruginibacter sp.]
MQRFVKVLFSLLAVAFSLASCSKKIKQQEDKLYSRHLQAHINLSIISTPVTGNKSDMNLLLLNDGQDIAEWKIKETLTQLIKEKTIGPLVVVAIHAHSREAEYGVAGFPDFKQRGAKADKYSQFIINELYPYIKKQTGIRSFKTVAIAGASLGGLSAMDIAWNNADKIDKVGVFSGSFWWRDKDSNAPGYDDSKNRILLNNIKSSRKRPKLQYWLYAGAKEETADRDKDGIIDVVDDTKDLIAVLKNKKSISEADIVYVETADGEHNYMAWSKALPGFLRWAFGK